VPSGITSYAVSSDGQLAAANLDYATLEIWNTTTEKKQIRYVSDMYPGLFSSDNQYLLMYYADMLAVFDIENKQFIAEVNRGYSEGLTAAFTPDSQQFAFFSAETGNIAVWDIAEEKMVRELTLPEPEKTIDIVFSPDGALLAISYRDGVMVLWAVAADKEVARVPADNHSLNEMRFNPAGTMIATAGVDGTVRLWGVGE
jgi:WD40 repeat protein